MMTIVQDIFSDDGSCIRIRVPTNINHVLDMSDDQVKELGRIFDQYRRTCHIEDLQVYGIDHWKNPFKVIVPDEDKDQLCLAINFFLADYPKVKPITKDPVIWEISTNGYQG